MAGPREFHTVVLAALLHDAGKFLQRGRSLPFDIGGPHPEVSARFVGAFAEAFGRVADAELLKTLVRHHHRSPQFAGFRADDIADPRSRLLAILINTADGLSSSERGAHAPQWQDFKTTPLASIFGRVFATEEARPLRHHPVPLATPRELTRSGLFPADFPEYPAGELEAALKQFGARAAALLRGINGGFDVLLAHLLCLFQTYAWPIPADTQEAAPDVSLYDHIRTTAAIAACLYRGLEESGAWSEASVVDRETERFVLAVGDVSGIQEYIFGVASAEDAGKGIARRLRARSLFVQLISEAVPLQVLRSLDLPVTNTIMASGGKFYLLLPKTGRVEEALRSAQKRLDDWFHGEMNGLLGLNLAWTSFAGSELAGGGKKAFGGAMKRAMERLAQRKDQRLRESLVAGGGWREDRFIFPPFGSDRQACASCHQFPAAFGSLCAHCKQDHDWGSALRGTRYVALTEQPAEGQRDTAGSGVTLARNMDRLPAGPAHVLVVNDPDTLEVAGFPASFKYLVTHTPASQTGEPLTFADIAKGSSGRPYLGFLKADVDGLGEVFAYGLQPWDSVSRLATLSRQMDLFFSGWVQHLLEVEFPDCYSVFSGGDDLFLVGPWDRVLDLAGRIREDFGAYTGGNPRLTLSAGMAIGQSALPIDQASHLAEGCLDRSKSQAPEKDRLTLLDHTLRWGEWQAVRAEWERLRSEVEPVTSSFLYNLMEYAGMWRSYKNGVGRQTSHPSRRCQPATYRRVISTTRGMCCRK